MWHRRFKQNQVEKQQQKKRLEKQRMIYVDKKKSGHSYVSILIAHKEDGKHNHNKNEFNIYILSFASN